MLKPSDKHFIRRIVFGKVGLIVLTVLFAVFAKGTWSVYQKAQFAKENRRMAEQELNELRTREAALQKELDRLNTPRGLEEEIRQQFDVGRSGERLIVLVDAPEPEESAPPPEPTIWERVIRFLGGR